MRLALEITELVRKELKDEILEVRVNADDYTKDGFNLEEAVVFSKRLKKLVVEILNVTAGTIPTTYIHISPMSMPEALLIEYVRKIKKMVNIPIMTADRLNDYEMTENILIQNKADFIGITRGLIGDLHLVEKWEKKILRILFHALPATRLALPGFRVKSNFPAL